MELTECKYDYYIHWTLLRQCNFTCVYCPSAYPQKKYKVPTINIPSIIERLDRFDRKLLITFTGGEPFLVPNFPELVAQITRKHYVRIDTNFSLKKSLENFLELVNPERIIEVIVSIHAPEREKRQIPVSNLIKMINRFRNKGFRIVGNYVVYPPLFPKLKDDINFFKKQGINVLPTLFYGKYGFKEYPFHKNTISYTQKEMQLIDHLNPRAKIILKNRKNTPCNAGSTAFAVDPNYKVTPCISIKKNLGNFFGPWQTIPRVIRCPVNDCDCAFNDDFPASCTNSMNKLLIKNSIKEKGILTKNDSYKATYNWLNLIISISRSTKMYYIAKKVYRRLS